MFGENGDPNDWWQDQLIGSGTFLQLNAFQAFAEKTNYDLRKTIPEPATMSLLALGGLALLRRRK